MLSALVCITFSLSFLWFVYAFLWRELKVEMYRQRLFKIRDELFDFATDGNISYDHPAYIAIRLSTNSLIRYAHQICFTRYLAFAVARSIRPGSAADAVPLLRPLLEYPEGETKTKLIEFHATVLFETLVFSTPFGFLMRHAIWDSASQGGRPLSVARQIEAHAIEADELLQPEYAFAF